jgi:hypothetical protein
MLGKSFLLSGMFGVKGDRGNLGGDGGSNQGIARHILDIPVLV